MQYYSVPDLPVTSYIDPTEVNRNRRHDTDESGGRRILSSSAINRITETLGALNTVGRYLVNMTRSEDSTNGDKLKESVEDEEEDDEDDDSSDWFGDDSDDEDDDEEYSDESDEGIKKQKKKKRPQSKPETEVRATTPKVAILEQRNDNIPEALLTLTSNVLGKNLTKTIEPLFKRVTQSATEGTHQTKLEDEEATKKSKSKTKTKKKKRENPKTKITNVSPTTSTTTTTTTTQRTTSRTTTSTTPSPAPQLSFLESIPSVVPTPTGTFAVIIAIHSIGTNFVFTLQRTLKVKTESTNAKRLPESPESAKISAVARPCCWTWANYGNHCALSGYLFPVCAAQRMNLLPVPYLPLRGHRLSIDPYSPSY